MNPNPTLSELLGEVGRKQSILSQRLLVAEEEDNEILAKRLREEWDELRLYGNILDERRDARVRWKRGESALGSPGHGPAEQEKAERWLKPDLESLIEEFEWLREFYGMNAVDGDEYYKNGWRQAMLALRMLRRRRLRAQRSGKMRAKMRQRTVS